MSDHDFICTRPHDAFQSLPLIAGVCGERMVATTNVFQRAYDGAAWNNIHSGVVAALGACQSCSWFDVWLATCATLHVLSGLSGSQIVDVAVRQ